MTAPPSATVYSYLRRFVVRQRTCAVLSAVGYALAFALTWMLLACLADRLLQLSRPVRWGFLITGILGVVTILIRPLAYLLFRRINWLDAAAALERHNPTFADRLRTVVSQLSERPEYRGSPQMLEQLLAQVTCQAEQDQPHRWIAWPALLRPWCLAGLMTLVVALLHAVPSLDMPTLIRRLVLPHASVAPVTVTRIALEPGNIRLVRGSPLTVRARIERLEGSTVEIFTSQDASSWARIPMLRAADGQYVFGLSVLDRDLYYYVRAGDARTETYKVTVLHAPSVTQLRLRYDYPAYTNRNSLDVVSNDGVIEALAGTKIQLTLLCTQPLRSASLAFSDRQLALLPGSDPATWQVTFPIDKDEAAELQLLSTAGLTTRIPNALTIRTQPDRNPLARLLQPAADLRLHPRDLMAVQYQVMDDYGITSLSLAVQVNSTPARAIAVPWRGDARRIEGQLQLDLATLGVVVGDVVTLNLVAQDGPAHTAVGEMRHILISPRSIDINTHQRIAELRQSTLLAATANNELQRAAELLETAIRTDGVGPEYITARVKASGRLAGGLEATLLLHQALLRACGKSASPEQTIALATCVDRARVQAVACERLTNADTRGENERIILNRLREFLSGAQELSVQIRTLSEGEQALAILADRANLRATPATQPADSAAAQRLQEIRRRAQEDLNWAVEELGLNPKSRDLEKTLQRKVDSANGLVLACKPIDFAQEASRWLAVAGPASMPLAERLASAASVETVRADKEPMIALDLRLASRVATRLAQPRLELDQPVPDPFREIRPQFPLAMATLQRDHQLRRQSGDKPSSPGEAVAIRASAEAIRKQLEQWASLPESMLAATRPAPPLSSEELALRASAETAQREYASADSLDQELLSRVVAESADPAAATHNLDRAVTRVRRIDDVSSEQQTITRQTASLQSGDPREAIRLSEQQQEVAERIYHIDENDEQRVRLTANADSRREATAAIQQIQEELARMPQQLTAALRAAESYRQTVLQAEKARQAITNAAPENRAMAQRNAEQAMRAVWDAEEELVEVGSVLSPESAARMAQTLRSYRPETDTATSTIIGQLQPSLQDLHKAMHDADKTAVDRTAARVRAAIEAMQLRLREAQAGIIESDPLVTARWFAEAAAQSLAQQPPDLSKARGHQQTVSAALGRAWQGAVRDAASVRLSMTPEYRSVVGTPAPPISIKRTMGSLIEMLPGLHQWSFLRPRQTDGISAPVGDTEPAGYKDALRVYFEYLGKNQQEAAGK